MASTVRFSGSDAVRTNRYRMQLSTLRAMVLLVCMRTNIPAPRGLCTACVECGAVDVVRPTVQSRSAQLPGKAIHRRRARISLAVCCCSSNRPVLPHGVSCVAAGFPGRSAPGISHLASGPMLQARGVCKLLTGSIPTGDAVFPRGLVACIYL